MLLLSYDRHNYCYSQYDITFLNKTYKLSQFGISHYTCLSMWSINKITIILTAMSSLRSDEDPQCIRLYGRPLPFCKKRSYEAYECYLSLPIHIRQICKSMFLCKCACKFIGVFTSMLTCMFICKLRRLFRCTFTSLSMISRPKTY